ncbi:unnamed protein product [Chrysoparadoxa australica]
MLLDQCCLVTSAEDAAVQALNPRTGSKLSLQIKNNLSKPGATALIGSKFVVSAQAKGSALHFWGWGSEQPLLKCHCPEKVGPVVTTDDGTLCASGGESGRIMVWDTGTGELVRSWESHYKAVTALRFAGDGSFLFSGGGDAMFTAWNVLEIVDDEFSEVGASKGPSPVWSAAEHSLPITSIAVNQTSSHLFTASWDRTARVWEASSGQLLYTVVFKSALNIVVADPAERFLFLGGAENHVYQLQLSESSATAAASDGSIGSSLEQEGLVSKLANFEATGGTLSPQELRGHSGPVTALCCSSQGDILVSGSQDGSVRVWHIASGQCMHVLKLMKGPISQVLVLPQRAQELAIRTRDTAAAATKQTQATLPPFKKFLQAGKEGCSVPPIVLHAHGRTLLPPP